MMSPETTVALIELAADVTRATILYGKDAASPEDFVDRLIGIGLNMAPASKLRERLDAADADLVDAAVDVAEEARLKFAQPGGQ